MYARDEEKQDCGVLAAEIDGVHGFWSIIILMIFEDQVLRFVFDDDLEQVRDIVHLCVFFRWN